MFRKNRVKYCKKEYKQLESTFGNINNEDKMLLREKETLFIEILRILQFDDAVKNVNV